MSTVTAPESWRVADGTVPLADVAKTAPVEYRALDTVVRTGLVNVQRQGGRGNGRHISLDDALMILAVAALATVAGVAFITLFRAVRNTGAQMGPGGLTIPIADPT